MRTLPLSTFAVVLVTSLFSACGGSSGSSASSTFRCDSDAGGGSGTSQGWTSPVGIPDPGFVISDERPAKPIPWNTLIDGYFYVNQETGSDTDNSNGTPANPRRTIPDPIPAGSYLEVHGKYSASPIWIHGQGTAGPWIPNTGGPVWVVGDESDRPEFGQQTVIYGRYVYVESINLRPQGSTVGRLQIGSGGTSRPADHIVVRKCDLSGNGMSGASGLIVSGRSDGQVTNVVVFRNTIHEYGNMSTTTDEDNAPVIVADYSSRIWVLENTMHTCTAGLRAGGQYAGDLSCHVYVGRNIVYNTLQAGLAVKRAENVVFSENVIHDIVDTSWSPAKGIGFQYQPTRFWILNNTIYNCYNGIRGASDDTTEETPVYIIGNVINNAKIEGTSAYGSTEGHGIEMNGSDSTRYIVGNTIYDTEVGISNAYNRAPLVIANNVIQGSSVADIKFDDGTGSVSTLSNTLFGNPAKIDWGDGVVRTLSAFQSQYQKGTNCLEGDASFTDPAGNDFSLRQDSPARNAGLEHEVFQVFQNRYGIDIRLDQNGVSRPRGAAWDMGAYEFVE